MKTYKEIELAQELIRFPTINYTNKGITIDKRTSN